MVVPEVVELWGSAVEGERATRGRCVMADQLGSESNGFGGSTCAFGREVGSRGSGSLLATWSLKCCQSVVDPLVSHVPRSSSIRWPSLSEHMRR